MSPHQSMLGHLVSFCSPGGKRGRLSLLQFHRVPGPDVALPPGEMSQAQFECVLDVVAAQMRVLPLGDALAAMTRGALPSRAVALTFDDGYAEWVDIVAPALKRRGLSATFFVTTGQLQGGGMWHERVNAAVNALPARGARLPEGLCGFQELRSASQRDELATVLQEVLKYRSVADRDAAILTLEAQATKPLASSRAFTADSVRTLHAQGFEIGAHTVTHPILSRCDDRTALEEIARSREELQAIVRAPVRYFAYPNGRPARDYNASHVAMVRRCGYEAAVSTGGGVAETGGDVFQLPRFTPWGPSRERTLFQIARNAIAPTPRQSLDKQPTRLMVVENGAGFGGAVIALQTLLAAIPRDKYDVHVVSNLRLSGFEGLGPVASYRVINDELIDFKPWVQRLMAQGPAAWRRGVAFGLGRLDDLVNRLPYLIRLYVQARKLRPALMHGNNEPVSNREAMLVAKLLGIPFVQHVRGPYAITRQTSSLLSRPDVFIPVSRWLAQRLVDDGVDPRRVRQIYDAVQVGARAQPEEAPGLHQLLGLPAGTLIIGMVGMLLPWKGQNLFVEAAHRLAVEHRQVAFVLVGAAPERGELGYQDQLQAQISKGPAAQRIFMLGHRTDVPQLMAQFAAVVSASIAPEPLGLVMLEAMSAGCIFVGPAHGAAPELIVDGENGFLFEPGSASELARSLSRALAVIQRESGARPTSLGQKAAEDVRHQFAARRCAAETENVYESQA